MPTAIIPVYATQADVIAYGVPAASVTDQLIVRAERDVDSLLGIVEPDATTGRKWVPSTLTVNDRSALRDAVCAQVEYRVEMGPAFFIRPQHESVGGPDYKVAGKLPTIGAAVFDLLEGSNLFKLTTSFKGAHKLPPWASFSNNIGDDLYDYQGPTRS